MKKMFWFVAILSAALLAMSGCGRYKSVESLIPGVWETESELSIIGIFVDGAEDQTAEMVYRLAFQEDGTGKNSIIVDAKYAGSIPDVNAEFTYMIDGDQLELTYEDGSIQRFTVSISGENLILDGRAHLELVRQK